MNAIVLESLAHNAHILERSSQDVLESQAAGIRAGPDAHSFIEKSFKCYEAYANTVDIIEVVDKNGDVTTNFRLLKQHISLLGVHYMVCSRNVYWGARRYICSIRNWQAR